MKILSKYLVINFVVALLLMSGCSDSFLDVKPIGKTTESNFYQTDEDAFMALMATYDILQMYSLSSFDGPAVTRVLVSDESNAGGGDESDLGHYQELDKYTYTSANEAIKRAYEVYYFGIYRANLVVDNIEASSDFTKTIVAEAKVLRALYYFELVTMFGGVPLHTTVPGASEYSKARATKEDIYRFIEQDLINAIPNLGHKSELSAADQFRVSVETAEALLGKVYLYQEKWSDAATTFGNLIAKEGSEVGLDPDFVHLWSIEGRWGVETLLNATFSSNENHNDNSYWGGSVRTKENNLDIVLMGPREGSFNLGATGLLLGWGFNSPRLDFFNSYVDAGDVVRRRVTLMSEAELVDVYAGSYDTINPAYGYDGVLRLKYGTYENQTNNNATDFLNYDTPYRLLRYADVLLMAAEAYYRNGNENQARIELNKVRARVSLADVTVGGADLFSAIVLERKLELAFEGQRFFDLVRWRLAGDVLGEDGFVTGKHELFPIPQEEIMANSAINAADQNPGW